MYLVINKCVTAVKVSNFSGHYLRKRSTLDVGVLGYIGIVQHKEHSLEVLSIPPGTLCIHIIQFHLYHSVNISSNWLQEQFCKLSPYTLHILSVQLNTLKK